MSHFAKVRSGVVFSVQCVEPESLSTETDFKWVQTSYNTYGGVHSKGGAPLRKNYAGVGFTYDEALDAFIPPKPFASWVLNEETCLWDAPLAFPDDGSSYIWDESVVNWVPFNNP